MDQFLRVSTAESNGETKEKVPMYIGLKDLMDTVNQAIKASSGDYQAAMSVIDLRGLIEDMTKKEGNSNDYRQAIMVPPTPENTSSPGDATAEASPAPASTPAPAPAPQTEPDDFNWEGKQSMYGNALKNDDFIMPSADDDWSD